MCIRKTELEAQDIRERINEYATVRTLLNQNKNELNMLQKKLNAGDMSVIARVRELFDLIDEKNLWISRNLPLIRSRLAS